MSLAETLQAAYQASATKIPADAMEIIKSNGQALADSVPGRSIPAVGDLLPEFALQDSQGTLVSSTQLAAKGPFILSFFRGQW